MTVCSVEFAQLVLSQDTTSKVCLFLLGGVCGGGEGRGWVAGEQDLSRIVYASCTGPNELVTFGRFGVEGAGVVISKEYQPRRTGYPRCRSW